MSDDNVYKELVDQLLEKLTEQIKELREENKALKNQINDLKKKELKCDHSYEVTDSQGHDMECSKCGKLWRLYEN